MRRGLTSGLGPDAEAGPGVGLVVVVRVAVREVDVPRVAGVVRNGGRPFFRSAKTIFRLNFL